MPKRWTEEEIKILKRHYRKRGANYVAKFVEHSPDTVMFKAAQLGIRTNKFRTWQKWEDNYLTRNYHIKKNSSIAKTLKRTIRSIHHRAEFLKLTKRGADKWTEDEKTLLRELYTNRNYTVEEVAKILNRSVEAVKVKAPRLGLTRATYIHRWTKSERNYLKKNAGKKTYLEIAAHLGIEIYKVHQYAKKLGLKKHDKGPNWTEEEKDFIRNNYYKIPIEEIALKLNRPLNSVKNTASRIGVSKSDKIPWSSEEIDYLKANFLKITVKEISKNLNRSKSSVSGKIRRLGLSLKRKSSSKVRKAQEKVNPEKNPGILSENSVSATAVSER
jgi:predicted transcriptional regulator